MSSLCRPATSLETNDNSVAIVLSYGPGPPAGDAEKGKEEYMANGLTPGP